MKYYSQFTLEYILYELPMMLGWALICWGRENDGWLQFGGIKRITPGYMAQEIKVLEKQYYDKFGKNQ